MCYVTGAARAFSDTGYTPELGTILPILVQDTGANAELLRTVKPGMWVIRTACTAL